MEYRFPLVAAVLEGRQQGIVWANSTECPAHFFVVNKFGFCQEFFRSFDQQFFERIKKFIQSGERPKLRMYAPLPHMEEFLRSTGFSREAARSHFSCLGETPAGDAADSGFSIRNFTREDLRATDFGLDLVNRYWNGEDDFLRNGLAVGAYDGATPVGICYAAGVGMNGAEVDVFVNEDCRGHGLGARLALKFFARCREQRLTPNWDCYSNNASSMRLAEKTGCALSFSYEFYNIGKIVDAEHY